MTSTKALVARAASILSAARASILLAGGGQEWRYVLPGERTPPFSRSLSLGRSRIDRAPVSSRNRPPNGEALSGTCSIHLPPARGQAARTDKLKFKSTERDASIMRIPDKHPEQASQQAH